LDRNKCRNCGKVGHYARDCWAEKKENKEKGKKKNANEQGRGADEANVGEEVAFGGDEEHYNFDTYNACNMEGNDKRLILYDWLADSATTSHITHQREAFTSYTPWRTCCSVTGVGGKEALIAG
jgi:Zinc knuckle